MMAIERASANRQRLQAFNNPAGKTNSVCKTRVRQAYLVSHAAGPGLTAVVLHALNWVIEVRGFALQPPFDRISSGCDDLITIQKETHQRAQRS